MQVFCSADLPVARPNIAFLTEQTRMELLVENFIDKSAFLDANDEIRPISEWRGVTVDEKGIVQGIEWPIDHNSRLFGDTDESIVREGGVVDLKFLPADLKKFHVFGVRLEGEIDTASLPRMLGTLNVGYNKFESTFETATLPGLIDRVILSNNMLYGTLDLTRLPDSLRFFHADANNFEGSAALHALPSKMVRLYLDGNYFSGSITFANLPRMLRNLRICNNDIAQDELVFVAQPAIQRISIDAAKFGRIVDANGNDADIAVFPEVVRLRLLEGQKG